MLGYGLCVLSVPRSRALQYRPFSGGALEHMRDGKGVGAGDRRSLEKPPIKGGGFDQEWPSLLLALSNLLIWVVYAPLQKVRLIEEP